MIEKVNPKHPDKIADRIAGAIVDLAYTKQKEPKIAVEVLIGHGECSVIIESSVTFKKREIKAIVDRICECKCKLKLKQVPQDIHLAENQEQEVKCGDNGIFKGTPLTAEERELSNIARNIYAQYQSDGKYILNKKNLIICQSNAKGKELKDKFYMYETTVNPLGDWTGGIDVDTGATNRKLGSDMGHAVTGGGLHGKDLSKADVSVNIYAFIKAQRTGKEVELCCAIGDDKVDGIPYSEVVNIARQFIKEQGGFEKFAEWGLV